MNKIDEIRARAEKAVKGTLIVKEDVQKRVDPESFIAYTPATSPALKDDLVQRGIFWDREEAESYAHAQSDREYLLTWVKELEKAGANLAKCVDVAVCTGLMSGSPETDLRVWKRLVMGKKE